MNLHADAAEVVARYRATDERQVALRADYLAHLAAHPDAMSRSCVAGHLTASAVILDEAGARVLLALHRKAKLWLQTGGHCEPGDATIAGAALREATEESGITALRILGEPVLLDRHPAPGNRALDHLDVIFVALSPSGATPVVSEESLDVAWFDVDELPEPTDDALRAMVAAGAARVRATQARS